MFDQPTGEPAKVHTAIEPFRASTIEWFSSVPSVHMSVARIPVTLMLNAVYGGNVVAGSEKKAIRSNVVGAAVEVE